MLNFNATNTFALIFMDFSIILGCILGVLGIIALIKFIKVCNIYIKEHQN